MSDIVKKLAGLAKEVVNDYASKGQALDDVIVKVAEREGLNSDEIKRLVEASNTMTWLTTVKPSIDKTAEFNVASYPSVMSKLSAVSTPDFYDVDATKYEIVPDPMYKAAEEAMAVESSEVFSYDALKDLSGLEKSAAVKAKRSLMSKAAAFEFTRLERSEFDLKCLMEETKEALASTIEKIANNLSSIYAEGFIDFEKKAYAALDNTQIKTVLDLIFNECTFQKEGTLRLDPIEATQYKNFPFYHEDKNIELLKEATEYLQGLGTLRRLLTEKSAEFNNKKNGYTRVLMSMQDNG